MRELTFEDFLRLGTYLYHVACCHALIYEKYYAKAKLNR